MEESNIIPKKVRRCREVGLRNAQCDKPEGHTKKIGKTAFHENQYGIWQYKATQKKIKTLIA